MVDCLYCKSTKTQRIDKYKCLSKEDETYFENIDIYQCKHCHCQYAYPLPSSDLLGEFYSKIYRNKNRYHYLKNPEEVTFSPWSNSQYAFISQFFDFDKANTIIDVGPGYGFLLREIRKYHPHLRLIAVDPDVTSLQYLQNYNIETQGMFFDKEGSSFFSDASADLIVSSHSLEHMTNLKVFFETSLNVLSDSGGIFIEVPNCEFNHSGYLNRSYDSPHLIFFTDNFLRSIAHDFDITAECMTTAGMPMKYELELMKKQYDNVRKKSFWDMQTALRQFSQFMPQKMKTAIKALVREDEQLANYYHHQYGGNRWTIRTFMRKQM